ncbi:hypothetical protein H2248_005247 [Termitomyces sp. 'cryptogamus']|nr:hypothetical protein H2248_005247 [Termitomyces sp. 'cryptogamus']
MRNLSAVDIHFPPMPATTFTRYTSEKPSTKGKRPTQKGDALHKRTTPSAAQHKSRGMNNDVLSRSLDSHEKKLDSVAGPRST